MASSGSELGLNSLPHDILFLLLCASADVDHPIPNTCLGTLHAFSSTNRELRSVYKEYEIAISHIALRQCAGRHYYPHLIATARADLERTAPSSSNISESRDEASEEAVVQQAMDTHNTIHRFARLMHLFARATWHPGVRPSALHYSLRAVYHYSTYGLIPSQSNSVSPPRVSRKVETLLSKFHRVLRSHSGRFHLFNNLCTEYELRVSFCSAGVPLDAFPGAGSFGGSSQWIYTAEAWRIVAHFYGLWEREWEEFEPGGAKSDVWKDDNAELSSTFMMGFLLSRERQNTRWAALLTRKRDEAFVDWVGDVRDWCWDGEWASRDLYITDSIMFR